MQLIEFQRKLLSPETHNEANASQKFIKIKYMQQWWSDIRQNPFHSMYSSRKMSSENELRQPSLFRPR